MHLKQNTKVADPEERKLSHDEGIDIIREFLTISSGVCPVNPDMYSIPELMLEFGQPYAVNENTYADPRWEPRQCYKNATRMALFSDDYTYVEGYITVHGIPIPHAFVVDGRGNVIDQTLQPPYGMIAGYFGIPFDKTYLVDRLLESQTYGMLEFNKEVLTRGRLVEGYGGCYITTD